jgi:hypothetical protein
MTIDRSVWLAQAREVLSMDYPAQSGPLTVIVRSHSGHKCVFREPHPNGGQTGNVPALSPLERIIVETILAGGNKRVPLKTVKARARLTMASNTLYAIMGNLAEREPPVLNANAAGYVVVGVLAEKGGPHVD